MNVNNANYPDVPGIGIPINIGIAISIGLILGVFNTGFEDGMSNGLMVGLTIGFIMQEVILIQFLSSKANVVFQDRLLNGEVTHGNRLLMLIFPPILLLVVGFLLAIISSAELDASMIVRIFCVAIILMFGIDPLYGLFDRGILAVFGASVVYVLILQAGFNGSDELPILIAPVIGSVPAISITSTIVIYLLLSTRWTYYRLFCFNQVENLAKVFIDTGLPLLLVLLPYFPKFFKILSYIYLGE